MSLEKSELLNLAFDSHATDLNKMRDGAESKMKQMAGAVEGLKTASKKIASFVPLIKDEILNENFKMPEDRAALTKLVVSWVGRCSSQCLALAEIAQDTGLRAEGQLRGLDMAIGMTKKRAEAEGQKAEGQKEAETKPDEAPQPATEAKAPSQGSKPRPGNVVPLRPVGVRPGQSVADQRKAEKADKKPAKSVGKVRKRKRAKTGQEPKAG